MFTMVRSSRVMKNPSEITTSTAHGFPRNFRTRRHLACPRGQFFLAGKTPYGRAGYAGYAAVSPVTG
jgi:hypothetical protein